MQTKRVKSLSAENNKEYIYEKMFGNNYEARSQFVCATQPLAPLLSADSFLCFDGDNFGLYYPWRMKDNRSNDINIDEDLKKYLDKKDAFVVPPIQKQRHLLEVFFDNIYPLYPVVERNILDDIRTIPLMLLNAIFTCTIRFDNTEDKKYVRSRSNEFFKRCKLLELAETNKITIIQSCLLLSMHEEGVEGATSSKDFITRACILCDELAITNMGGSNGSMNTLEKSDLDQSNIRRVPYKKDISSRLFWISFCCDRLVSATSGRAMYYNLSDLMIDEPTIYSFDEGENQEADFQIFTKWCNICKLIDRILCAMYRPPQNRTLDDNNLMSDLLEWKIDVPMNDTFANFLRIFHGYACVLYFRCKVDLISLISSDTEIGNVTNNSIGQSMALIHEYSKSIIDLVDSKVYVHHILIVHAILHVIALVQLEASAKIQFKDANWKTTGEYFIDMMNKSISALNSLKSYWWFADAALRLCKVTLSPELVSFANELE